MDDLDRAKESEQKERAAALEAQQQRAAQDDDTHPLEIDRVRVCVDCLEPIDAERLKIRPNAERCVACKERREQEQK